MSEKLHCIPCGREMDNLMEGRGHQPSHGLSFHTYGHYGYAFFDPMDGSCIQISICDECLEKADAKGWIARPKERNKEIDLLNLGEIGVVDEDWDTIDGIG